MKRKLERLIIVAVILLVIIGFYSTSNTVQAKGGGKLWTDNGDDIYNENTGNVGVGTTSPTEKLTVNGKVESTSGGFKFPDGTSQTTAAFNDNDGDWTVFGNYMYSAVTGNVGIGTTNPKSNLQIGANLNLIHDPTRGKWIAYNMYVDTPNYHYVTTNQSTAIEFDHANFGDMAFWTWPSGAEDTIISTGSPRMLIRNNGNVGIGTANPQAKLHIGGNSGVDGLMFPDGTLQTTAAISGGSSLWATNSSDIYNTNTGKVGIGTANPEAKLHVVGAHPLLIDNTGSPTNDSILFRRFGVNKYSLAVTEDPSLFIFDHAAQAFRFALISNGNVGINDTAPSERLTVGGNVKATSFIQVSSRELKEDITVISTKEAIETIQGLNPIKFKYKADITEEEQLGFIAEDVPELVATKDRKGLSSMDMTAVLVRVVQDQQRVLIEQQETMETMRQEIQKMKLTMNTL
ncbi:MAG: tail fiber domain-containing protein [Planctomycetota bacterium]|jgi:hypothetical protein